MKGGMKKAFTALLAATVLVGGMPVNMQANVIAETEKAESASEKVNEKYADTEELDLMDRERQETQAGEQEKRENTGAARVGRNRTARHRRTVRGDRAARHRRTAGGDRAARHRNRTAGNGRRNRRTGRNFNQGGRK